MTYEFEELDKNTPFEVEYVPFLNKKSVQSGCKIKIIDVKKGIRRFSPMFLADFPGGRFRFDLCQSQFNKLLNKYGNLPKNWIGTTWYIKAFPYKDGKMEGLRLHIDPQ